MKRLLLAAGAVLLTALPAKAEEVQVGDFAVYCQTRVPLCIAQVADDLTHLQDTFCGPEPFVPSKEAPRVYAFVMTWAKDHPTDTLWAAETEASDRFWPCKKP